MFYICFNYIPIYESVIAVLLHTLYPMSMQSYILLQSLKLMNLLDINVYVYMHDTLLDQICAFCRGTQNCFRSFHKEVSEVKTELALIR